MSEPTEAGNPQPVSPVLGDTDARTALGQAGVVHDVNQMLAVILGRAELLLQREGGEGDREDLQAIALATRDAAAMLKRLQRGLPPRQPGGSSAAVNLKDTVAEVFLLIRPAGSAGWHQPGQKAPSPAWVMDPAVPGDLYTTVPGQVVREVLSNLVVNALEAMPTGGRVEIDALAEGERVVVTVTDSGPGLDRAAADHIFEPGYTSSGQEFRGVGLAGSRQLLKCFDGRLDLASQRGPGASFQLDLPMIRPPAKSVGERASDTETRSVPEARSASFPVLVVDDDEAVRGMLADVLAELDCLVTVARDARTALDHFAPGVFGLVVVDQTLPGRSGMELASLLRQQDPEVIIALISGWGQEELLAGVDPASVDLTASKPLDWARINEILNHGAALLRERRETGSG